MKRNRKKVEIRDRLTFKDLLFIFSLTSGKDYEQSRNFVAIVMLYITGLRVANFRHIKINNLHELREKKFTFLPIIKNGPPRHPIQFSDGDTLLLEAAGNRLELLCQSQTKTDSLFISKENCSNKGRPIGAGYFAK